jgi:hypothetical protein
MALPIYLLRENCSEAVLGIFSKPGWEGTFHTATYLKALAVLKLGRFDEAMATLEDCLRYYPQVARFILDIHAPPQDADTPRRIVCGSAYEGWFYGRQYAPLWLATPGAIEFLTRVSMPLAAEGWERAKSV